MPAATTDGGGGPGSGEVAIGRRAEARASGTSIFGRDLFNEEEKEKERQRERIRNGLSGGDGEEREDGLCFAAPGLAQHTLCSLPRRLHTTNSSSLS